MNYLEFLAGVDDSHPMTTAVQHIEVLCRYAKLATSILELGSHAGISAAAMALANPHATIVSVDLCDTVNEQHRIAYWQSLGIASIHPVAGSAGDYLKTSPRFGMVFHDAVHGDAAMPEYKLCVDLCDILAIHDFEKLSQGNQALLRSMFVRVDETADSKGRVLFVGWAS